MAKSSVPNLAEIEATYPMIGRALRHLENVGNNLGAQTNAEPVGQTAAPQAHANISVKGGAGILDVAVTDNSPQTRGKQHFFDYSNDGGQNWHTKPMGPSKNWRGSLGSGTFTVRSYSQFPTSEPSSMKYHAPVDTSGSEEPPMQSGQGSGTGKAGFGEVAHNTPLVPKR